MVYNDYADSIQLYIRLNGQLIRGLPNGQLESSIEGMCLTYANLQAWQPFVTAVVPVSNENFLDPNLAP